MSGTSAGFFGGHDEAGNLLGSGEVYGSGNRWREVRLGGAFPSLNLGVVGDGAGSFTVVGTVCEQNLREHFDPDDDTLPCGAERIAAVAVDSSGAVRRLDPPQVERSTEAAGPWYARGLGAASGRAVFELSVDRKRVIATHDPADGWRKLPDPVRGISTLPCVADGHLLAFSDGLPLDAVSSSTSNPPAPSLSDGRGPAALFGYDFRSKRWNELKVPEGTLRSLDSPTVKCSGDSALFQGRAANGEFRTFRYSDATLQPVSTAGIAHPYEVDTGAAEAGATVVFPVEGVTYLVATGVRQSVLTKPSGFDRSSPEAIAAYPGGAVALSSFTGPGVISVAPLLLG